MTDDSWPMIEEAVFRLFDDIAGKHTAVGPRLDELGWSEIESEYSTEACELLFRAQGRSLAQTDCLDRVVLAELATALGEPIDALTAVVMPALGDGFNPSSEPDRVHGIVAGPVHGRLAVPVYEAGLPVSIGVVDADSHNGERLATFDESVHWTLVSGPMRTELGDASSSWNRAVAAAHRALGTELIAITEQILQFAVEHAKSRVQFGTPIGSFQSPRHALAEACATLEGARALMAESWRYGGQVSAHAAKAAAGRAHRVVSDTALQSLGAIGLTAEHNVHRYVSRGFQIDSLFGSCAELETSLAEQLFITHKNGQPLPQIVTCG
jgi:hypothetical protein